MIEVALDPLARAAIATHAANAMLGGRSAIYGTGARRTRELRENQVVGMAAEAAFYRWAFGPDGVDAWAARRRTIDADPWKGDGGADAIVDGVPVDVKATETRRFPLTRDEALRYHLTHAPRDRVDPATAYVLALTRRAADNAPPLSVLLIGWLPGEDLKGREDRPDLIGWSARGDTLLPLNALHVPTEEDGMSKWKRDVKREIESNPNVTRAKIEVTRGTHLRAAVTFTDGRTREIRTSSTPSDWRTLKDVARKVRAAALGEHDQAAA